ncbi:hypothetical protein HZB89_00610, partial [archaeon]|nr:hypothetical protein [archaeon]
VMQKNDGKAILALGLLMGSVTFMVNSISDISMSPLAEPFNAVGPPFIVLGLVLIGLGFFPALKKTIFASAYLLLFCILIIAAIAYPLKKIIFVTITLAIIASLLFIYFYLKTKHRQLLFFLAGIIAFSLGGSLRPVHPLLLFIGDGIGYILWFLAFESPFEKKPSQTESG